MTPEELKHEIAKEAKEAQEQKIAMQGLICSPGWLILSAILDAQIANRTRNVMSGPTSEEKEWEKGEASGLKLARTLPEIILEVAESIVPEKTDDGDDTDDTSTDDQRRFEWDDTNGDNPFTGGGYAGVNRGP